MPFFAKKVFFTQFLKFQIILPILLFLFAAVTFVLGVLLNIKFMGKFLLYCRLSKYRVFVFENFHEEMRIFLKTRGNFDT
jgi:hypothetical protein